MSTDPHHDEIRYRLKLLADFGTGLIPTRLPACPEPDDIELIGSDLRALCRVVDPLIQAYGEYVRANVPDARVDMLMFRDVLLNALDGNATFELSEAADCIRESEMEDA